MVSRPANFSPAEQQTRMFGDPTWEQQCWEYFERHHGQTRMYAIGILSDAQEVASMIRPSHPTSNIMGELETIRQYINKAKYVMSNYTTSAFTRQEVDTLVSLRDKPPGDWPVDTKRTLEWLMDPRR